MNVALPAALEPFRDQLLATAMPFVRARAEASRVTRPWDSKVGGAPYLPKGEPWPCAPDGKELFFLAQINFAQMPRLAPFPEKGIIGFYIHDDDLYGMDFDNGENQDYFRVLFFPETTENESVLQSGPASFRDYEDLLPHHPDECYPLSFSLEEGIAPITDFRFYEKMGADFFRQFGEQEWDVMAEYEKSMRATGHRIGGYAYFTQDDPRSKDNPMLLLLQLDSDEKMDLMWGDMGVGHFFIREQDLAARNFSGVLYDWDCL